jgi:hypothetical protein
MQMIQLNESTVSRRVVYLWSLLSDGLSPAQFEAGGQAKVSVAGLAPWSSAGTLLAIDTTNGEYALRLGSSDVSVLGPGLVRYSSTSALETCIPFQVIGFNPYGSLSTFDASAISVQIKPSLYSGVSFEVFAIAPATYSGVSVGVVAIAPGTYSSVTVGTGSLSTAAGNTAADLLLLRSIAGGVSSGRTVGEAFAVQRNKVTISGSMMTVYRADDTTSSWTASITTDPATGLITGIDPA